MSTPNTPGPWFLPKECAGSNGTQVWARGGDVRVANCDSTSISLEGRRRDARLISATLELADTVSHLLRWAAQKCPCENELPNPCTLCGASVENLEHCKAADATLPPDLLEKARAALAKATGGAA